MMKNIVIVLLIVLSFHASAQNFKERFEENEMRKDNIEQEKILEEWSQQAQNDPDYYHAVIQYYYKKSIKNYIKPEKFNINKAYKYNIPEEELPNYSDCKIIANVCYDTVLLATAIDFAKKGSALFPDRLDLRMTQIALLAKSENFSELTKEILTLIDYSSTIHQQWKTGLKDSLENIHQYFLDGIQEYEILLYNTGKDEQWTQMQQIANKILEYYPNHIESMANVAIVYMLQNQFDKAIEVLQKAHALAPKDSVILSNLAQAYEGKGDKKKAKEYYQYCLYYGDKLTKQFAKEKLSKL